MDPKYKPFIIQFLTKRLERVPTDAEVQNLTQNVQVQIQVLFLMLEKIMAKLNVTIT
jgi:hypothetical protein